MFLAAWNILRRQDAAEDAVHSAFVSLVKLEKIPKEPRLYAFRCVRNAAIDELRRIAKRPIHQTIDGTDSAVMCYRQPAWPDEELEFALDTLDEELREIIELHLLSHLSFREIGELTATPTQTIATRYRRALVKVREQIGTNACD